VITDLTSWDSSTLSISALHHCAKHAAGVYDPTAYIKLAISLGYNDATVLKDTNAQAALAWSDRIITVSICGSNDIRDWTGNLLSWVKVRWKANSSTTAYYTGLGGKIGYGFRNNANRICPHVLSHVRALLTEYPEAAVYITGHSLGASIAPLVALYLRDYSVTIPVTVVMIEAPRVGNEAFAQHYAMSNIPTWSVVNATNGVPDIVTRVPKRSWGFRHVGRRVILDNGTVFASEQCWQQYRAANPYSSTLATWRLVSRVIERVRQSVQAHYAKLVLEAFERIDQ